MLTETFRLKGTTPLMMHNVQLANPMNSFAKELALLNKQKKVKGADKEEIGEDVAKVEWTGGLYYDGKIGPYLPASNLHKAIIEAARMTKEGKSVEQGVMMPSQQFKILYDGPRDLEGLWAARDRFVDVRIVKVGQSKVPRARPIFQHWEVEVTIAYDPEMCSKENLRRFLVDAGTYKGVGEARGGTMGMGRFQVQNDDGSWPKD